LNVGDVSCSVCGLGRAVYMQEWSGTRFCASCFVESVEKRVRKTISRYGLLREDDRIAVAVSGGKDSLALLRILWKIERDFPNAEIVAVSVDEGIPGYRDEALELASTYSRKLGVKHVVYSFKDLFGVGLVEADRNGLLDRLRIGPCTLCGVWRRKALSIAAKKVGATVVATAHTLDDIVQTYIMDMLRGSFPQNLIGVRRGGDGVVPRVAPLRLIPEKEVVLYAYLTAIPFQQTPCPNAERAQRDLVRNFLTIFDDRYPGSLFAALHAIESQIRDNKGQAKPCEVCGEPTSRKICRACELEIESRRLMKLEPALF
jgi:uncharacterized protein (TIGR00269 family)